MNTMRISLGLLSTLTLLASAASAQLLELPRPGSERRVDPPGQNSYSDEKYYPAKTYAGSNCKDTYDGYSASYEYAGGYFNGAFDYSDVICPITNYNDPYQKWIYSDVHVTDQSYHEDFWCELKKATPVRGGWVEYSSGSKRAGNRPHEAQQIRLNPVPGGYNPDSHVYLHCHVPSYAYVGNYTEYSGQYEYYRNDYKTYDYHYLESRDYDGRYYEPDSYDSYDGWQY